MISLTSCKKDIICKEVNLNQINPIVLYDISIQFDRCRARCFDMNNWKALPISSCPKLNAFSSMVETFTDEEHLAPIEAVNFPLNMCDGISGFDVSTIASEIRPKIKSMAKLRLDTCGI